MAFAGSTIRTYARAACWRVIRRTGAGDAGRAGTGVAAAAGVAPVGVVTVPGWWPVPQAASERAPAMTAVAVILLNLDMEGPPLNRLWCYLFGFPSG